MKVSISEIKEYQTCPMSWYLKYIIKKQKRNRSELALNVGSYGHYRLEEFFSGDSMGSSIKALMEVQQGNEQWLDELDKVDYTLEWFLAQPFVIKKILEVEGEGEVNVGMHQVPTKTDLVGLDADGKLWHVQWKFLSERTDLPGFCGMQERAMHECTYRKHLTAKYPQYEYMGTKLVVFLKRGIHKTAKGEECGCKNPNGSPRKGVIHRDPSLNVFTEDLLVDEAKQAKAERNISHWVNEMDMMQERDIRYVPQAETSCLGKFGACQFNAYCNGEADMGNELFWETVNPYGHYKGGTV